MIAVTRAAQVADNKKPWLVDKNLDDLAGVNLTEPSRVYHYDYYMIYWLCEALGENSAEILKPIIRAGLKAKFDQKRDVIEALQRNRREAEAIKAAATEHINAVIKDADEKYPPKPRRKRS